MEKQDYENKKIWNEIENHMTHLDDYERKEIFKDYENDYERNRYFKTDMVIIFHPKPNHYKTINSKRVIVGTDYRFKKKKDLYNLWYGEDKGLEGNSRLPPNIRFYKLED